MYKGSGIPSAQETFEQRCRRGRLINDWKASDFFDFASGVQLHFTEVDTYFL